jgi:antitoxin CptB
MLQRKGGIDKTPSIMQEALRKKLLWRATHRGIKEMDLIVGGYAERNLAQMSVAELEEFSRILDLPDQDLLSWATLQSAVPASVDGAMLRSILNYVPA